MLPEAISKGPLKMNCQIKRNANGRPQRSGPNVSRRYRYDPPAPGNAAPKSHQIMPSQIARSAPASQPNSACGPGNCDKINGTVKKTPMPTMLDMLNAVAWSRFSLRVARGEEEEAAIAA